VHRPSLIIADEPTSALDDTHAREAITLLKTLTVNNGAALIVVTHDERIRNQLGRQFDLRAMK
jgi:putative ABC transport system ATP-binding protein